MKKLSVVALAVVAVMLFAIPAMAVDVNFEGQYRARGYYMNNSDLDDDCGGNDAFYDQRFRLLTVFKVHENLSVTTRWDAFDNVVWGTTDLFGGSNNSMNWDRAYLTAKFPWFTLDVGRQGGGVWGTLFADYSYSVERIKVTSKVDNLVFGGIIQKTTEQDGGQPSATGLAGLLNLVDEDGVNDCLNCDPYQQVEDQDRDTYYLFFVYKGEGWNGGVLLPFDRKYYVTGAGDLRIKEYAASPYIQGKFGPLDVESEFWYDFGSANPKGGEDYDIKNWAFYVDLGFDAGPVGIDVGYAHTTGQEKLKDAGDDRTAWVQGGGRDWQPLLILTGYYMDADLGCLGNLNYRNNGNNPFGFDLFYGKAEFSPAENVTLSTILGYAQAAETGYVEQVIEDEFGDDVNIDKDFGWEWDVGLKWQLMDNLVYDAKAGYLWAGDLWKYGCDHGVDNTWSILHALTVTF